MDEQSQNRPLEGRVAIITGASAGIGEAIARHFARCGAKVVINARRAEALAKIEREIDEELGVETAHFVTGDCAEPSTVDHMLQAAADHFGRQADLVVVNAGRGLAGSVVSSDEAQWEELVRTNLLGAARLMRAAAKQMLQSLASPDGAEWERQPRDIVVLGSTVGRHISPFSSMYGSTKFGVNSLAEALRRELGPSGIRVSLVEPGIVVSEFQQVAGYDPDGFGRIMEEKGPVLEPMDVARLLEFICAQPARVTIGDVVIRGTRQDYP